MPTVVNSRPMLKDHAASLTNDEDFLLEQQQTLSHEFSVKSLLVKTDSAHSRDKVCCCSNKKSSSVVKEAACSFNIGRELDTVGTKGT